MTLTECVIRIDTHNQAQAMQCRDSTSSKSALQLVHACMGFSIHELFTRKQYLGCREDEGPSDSPMPSSNLAVMSFGLNPS